jgi:hypothetical protein
MAGDYIPIRVDLRDDPDVIKMAAILGIKEDDVVGRLVRTWGWFNSHTEDGHAFGVTSAWLDQHTVTPGWSDAMAGVGWLEISDDRLTVPKYDSWNSEAAKKRLKAAERKRKQRAKEEADSDDTPEKSQDGHTSGVTKLGPHNRTGHNTTGQDKTSKDDRLCSWDGKTVKAPILKDWCNQQFVAGKVFTASALKKHTDTRDMLLRVGVLRLCDAVSEAFVEDGCEALRRCKARPNNPGAYLRTVWSRSKYLPDGVEFAELLAAVVLPEGI